MQYVASKAIRLIFQWSFVLSCVRTKMKKKLTKTNLLQKREHCETFSTPKYFIRQVLHIRKIKMATLFRASRCVCYWLFSVFCFTRKKWPAFNIRQVFEFRFHFSQQIKSWFSLITSGKSLFFPIRTKANSKWYLQREKKSFAWNHMGSMNLCMLLAKNNNISSSTIWLREFKKINTQKANHHA